MTCRIYARQRLYVMLCRSNHIAARLQEEYAADYLVNSQTIQNSAILNFQSLKFLTFSCDYCLILHILQDFWKIGQSTA